MEIYKQTYTYTHMHARTRAHTHTHTHTHYTSTIMTPEASQYSHTHNGFCIVLVQHNDVRHSFSSTYIMRSHTPQILQWLAITILSYTGTQGRDKLHYNISALFTYSAALVQTRCLTKKSFVYRK